MVVGGVRQCIVRLAGVGDGMVDIMEDRVMDTVEAVATNGRERERGRDPPALVNQLQERVQVPAPVQRVLIIICIIKETVQLQRM